METQCSCQFHFQLFSFTQQLYELLQWKTSRPLMSISCTLISNFFFLCCFLIIAFHSCVPEVHTTNRERNEFPRRCQPWVTSFVPDKDIPQSFLFFFQGVRGTLLLTCSWQVTKEKKRRQNKTYGLKFHCLGRENCLSSAFIWLYCAAEQYSRTCWFSLFSYQKNSEIKIEHFLQFNQQFKQSSW